MKVKFLSLVMAAVTVVSIASLASCKEKETLSDKFQNYNENGYTIAVKFDAGGAQLKGKDSTVIDVFNPDLCMINADGKRVITLVSPEDARRDKNNPLTYTKPGEYIIGWYTERAFKNGVDDKDGYIYSGLWDFEKDAIEIDPAKDYSKENIDFTLYAAWVPYFTFNIYAEGQSEPIQVTSDIYLTLPKWEAGESTITMGDINERSGYTFDKIYSDENYTNLITDETISGLIDIETGTLAESVINLYTTWYEGTHYQIYEADDLKEVTYNATYHIMADLNFEGKNWPFNTTSFEGKIYGNGHKISNVTFESTYANYGFGMFASLSENAEIKDLTFENVTHKFNVGRVTPGSTYGMFAGSISETVKIENVSINGKFTFIEDSANLKNYENIDYTIGIFAGTGTPDGIDISGIETVVSEECAGKFTLSQDDDGVIKLIFNK